MSAKLTYARIFTLLLSLFIIHSAVLGASNQPPITQDDTADVLSSEWVDINVLANDSDPDGDPISVVAVNKGEHGNLVINEDSTITYVPDPNYGGTDAFTYTVRDDKGATAVGTVTVTVTYVRVPQPPTVTITSPSTYWSVNLGQKVDFCVEASDPDGTVEEISFYLDGEWIGVIPGSQTTFTWEPLWAGKFEVKAIAVDSDGLEAVSNTIQLTVIEVVNCPPFVRILEPMTGARFKESDNIPILIDGYDKDGVIKRIEVYANESLIRTAETCPYTFVWINPFIGSCSLTVRAYDDKGAVCVSEPVDIWVECAPVAVDDHAAGKENEPLEIDVLANDYDLCGDTVCIASVTKADHGAALIRDRVILFTPELNFHGSDCFSYRIVDSCGQESTAKVCVEINSGQCDIPQIRITHPIEGAMFTFGQDIHITVSVSDQGSGIEKVVFYDGGKILGTSFTPPFDLTWLCPPVGVHSLTARAADKKGEIGVSKAVTVTVNAAPNCPPTVEIVSPKSGSAFPAGRDIPIAAEVWDKDGQVVRVDFFQDEFLIGSSTTSPFRIVWPKVRAGTYALRAKAVDNAGAVGLSEPVTVIVDCGPVAKNDQVTINQNTRAIIDVLVNDSDSDGNAIFLESVSQPRHGRTTITETQKVRYEPNANFVGTDEFVYTIKDVHGMRAFGLVVVLVKAVPGPPFIMITSPCDGTMFTAGDDVAIAVKAGARNAEVVKVEFFVDTRQLSTVTESPFGFTWKQVQAGSHVLTAKATDSNGEWTISSPVNIKVNSPPVARADTVTTLINTTVDINVLGNDEDPDGESIKLVQVDSPSQGVISVFEAKISYLPAPGFTGTDEFAYCIVDPHGLTSCATVTITVTPIPELPTIVITSPTKDAVFMAGDTITMSAEVSNAGAQVSRVEFGEGNCILGYATSNPYNFVWTNVPAGARTLSAWVVDKKGKTLVSDALTIQVNTPTPTVTLEVTPPPAPPEVEEVIPGPCAPLGLIVLSAIAGGLWFLTERRWRT